MTTSDELAKASAFLKDGFLHYRCPDWCEDCDAARAIAEWALPLLDNTPIDEAWLRSVGFKVEFDEVERELRIPIDDDRWLAAFAPSQLLGYSFCIEGDANYALLPEYKTRGELRLLCRALNIELTEK